MKKTTLTWKMVIGIEKSAPPVIFKPNVFAMQWNNSTLSELPFSDDFGGSFSIWNVTFGMILWNSTSNCCTIWVKYLCERFQNLRVMFFLSSIYFFHFYTPKKKTRFYFYVVCKSFSWEQKNTILNETKKIEYWKLLKIHNEILIS